MRTTTAKNVRSAAAHLRKIADAYATVYENNLIRKDMETYIFYNVNEFARAMKEDGKFSYRLKFYIRHRGVEVCESRVAALGDTVIAEITIDFNKDRNLYTIVQDNR